MIVLSLFDGISCGQLALQRAGITVSKYYASEILPDAMKITHKNFPNTIDLGDITQISNEMLDTLPKIDLLIGGSPCQDLSVYKFDRGECSGLNGEKSGLFYHYLRILKYVNPTYFLLENVPMQKKWETVISECLGVQPILIDSALVCAADRKRLYWTNIPNVIQPKDKGIVLRDIVQPTENVPEKYWYNKPFQYNGDNQKVQCTLEMKGHRHMKEVYNLNGKCCTLTTCNGGNLQKKVYQDGRCRKLTPLEYERLQTLPDGYTEGVCDTSRYSAIGNGWTVDVIAHIFSNLKGVQTMIKCKQAMEDSLCGKSCCCLECEEREKCEDVCSNLSPNCKDAINEETALAIMQTEAAAIIKGIAALTLQKKQIEDQEKEMRVQLMAAMEKYGVKSFENEDVKFTYVAATTRTTIDSTKLKKDLPDVATKYSKTSKVSASVKITVK